MGDIGSFREGKDEHVKNGTSALISSRVVVRKYSVVLLITILKIKLCYL
jgi:hypothetical protein